MATYSKETSLFKTGAIGAGIQDAGEKATNYLSQDSSGIMVYDATDGSIQYPSTATGKNVFIDSDSVDIRAGQTVNASFGGTIQLGNEQYSHVDIAPDAIIFMESDKPRISIQSGSSGEGEIGFYNNNGVASGFIIAASNNRFVINAGGSNNAIKLVGKCVEIPALLGDGMGRTTLFDIVERTVMSSRSITAGSAASADTQVSLPSGYVFLGIIGYETSSGDINVSKLQFHPPRTISYNLKNVGSQARTTDLTVQLLAVKAATI